MDMNCRAKMSYSGLFVAWLFVCAAIFVHICLRITNAFLNDESLTEHKD